jgi:hypothetical protein
MDHSLSTKPSTTETFVFVLMRFNEDDGSHAPIGIFDTSDQARVIARDEEVMNYFGGTLENGSFYIIGLPFNPSLAAFKNSMRSKDTNFAQGQNSSLIIHNPGGHGNGSSGPRALARLSPRRFMNAVSSRLIFFKNISILVSR